MRYPRILAVFFALIFTLAAAANGRVIKAPPSGFIDLRQVMSDACFPIPYATASNFTGAPLPGYAAPGAWARPKTAAALVKAHQSVKVNGKRIAIFDAYRPMRASKEMTAWATRVGRADLIGVYIASSGYSGHNKGNTVDVGLTQLGSCVPIDMGVPFDTFSPEANTMNATGQVLTNRLELKSIMEAKGFTNYAKEWWHFSFADEPNTVAIDMPYEYETQ